MWLARAAVSALVVVALAGTPSAGAKRPHARACRAACGTRLEACATEALAAASSPRKARRMKRRCRRRVMKVCRREGLTACAVGDGGSPPEGDGPPPCMDSAWPDVGGHWEGEVLTCEEGCQGETSDVTLAPCISSVRGPFVLDIEQCDASISTPGGFGYVEHGLPARLHLDVRSFFAAPQFGWTFSGTFDGERITGSSTHSWYPLGSGPLSCERHLTIGPMERAER